MAFLQSASDLARKLYAEFQQKAVPAVQSGVQQAQKILFQQPIQQTGQQLTNFVAPHIPKVPQPIVNTINTVGTKIGQAPVINLPLNKIPTNLQTFQGVSNILGGQQNSPATSFLSGKVQKVPGQLASSLNESFGSIRPGETQQQYFERTSGAAIGAVNPLESKAVLTPVQKVIQALKEAKPIRGEQEALYSAERARRVARIASVGKSVPGEKGYFAQLGQLKGELPKVNFESIRKTVTQPDIDSFFNTVEQSHITPFEKITAKTGLAKLLGAEGGVVPNKSELALLNEIFPPEFTRAVMSKRPLMQKLFSASVDALNLPRAVMATADLSAPLRQGIFLVGRPKQFLPAFRDMFKYAGSEKAYQGLTQDIQSRPTYQLMRENKLALTDMGENLSKREETFMSTLPQKIPVFGHVVKGSNRAYSGFLNKLRADTFDELVRSAKESQISGTNVNADIANFVNTATGRGNLGAFQKANEILNATMFSPRLVASRVNLLNPVYYAKLDPFVRKEALKSLVTFAGTGLTVLGLAKLGGAEVVADPRNSDFGKIKIGNTRYDIWGGFQQYIKLAAQLATGKLISSTTGREITLGDGYKPLTRKDILLRFLESKESPVASLVSGLMTGQSATGEPLNVPAEVISRFIPLLAQDIYDLYQEGGIGGTMGAIPGAFGVGSQTYGKQETVSGENEFGMPTTQVRPVQDLPSKIAEKIFGQQPVSNSASYNVEAYYNQLLKMPKPEAAAKFNEIAKSNPDLAKKIVQVVKDRQAGITVKDQGIKAKGVASGERATYIAGEFRKLKTNEEKAKLWDEWVKKKIITKDIVKELNDMKQRGEL